MQKQLLTSTVDFRPNDYHSEELEGAILGAILLESDAFGRVKPILKPHHFYKPINAELFQLMCDMFSSGLGIDSITVTIEANRRKMRLHGVDNLPYYLTCLDRDVCSTAHLEQYAAYLREYYAKRELLRIQMEAPTDNMGTDVLDRAMKVRDSVQEILAFNSVEEFQDISQVMVKLSKHMDEVVGKDLLGIPTGFKTLDKLTAGWQPGQLIIIGARPSVGKTAFICKIIIMAALKGFTVGLIQLEMIAEMIGARLLSIFSKVPFWRIWRSKFEDNSQAEVTINSMGDLANLPILISDKTKESISDIRAKAIKLKKRGKLDLLIIDYLQLMEGEGKSGTREQEVAKMSRGLKLLALELKVPIIVLCQLNRDSDKAPDKMPRMSNIRESGAIEQDADIIMLLHRAWKAGILADDQGNSTENQAQIILEKHRNGETTVIDINFEPESMHFYE